MSVLKRSVLLLKSEKSDDVYRTILEANNFEVMSVRTLVFRYKNLDVLLEKLEKPGNFSGIIFTSPRCVSAVYQALNNSSLEVIWRSKFNFCVGSATFKEAEAKLGIVCEGKDAGNAKNLAQIILKQKNEFTKPFLVPHGNLNSDTLKLELRKFNLQLEEVLTYDTLPNSEILAEIEKCTNHFSHLPEYLVFFSPSGFHNTIYHLKRVIPDLNEIKIIAIGPTTQLAIEEANFTVYSVAKSPTPEEVVNAILNKNV